jgi:hypothetical protein
MGQSSNLAIEAFGGAFNFPITKLPKLQNVALAGCRHLTREGLPLTIYPYLS